MKITRIKPDGSGTLFQVAAEHMSVLSYHAMAKKLGIDPAQISRVKTGQYSPSDVIVVAILRACPKLTMKQVDKLTKKGTV